MPPLQPSTAGFDWTGFGADVASTAVGAVLGFGFALLLAYFSQRSADKRTAEGEAAKVGAAIAAAIQACGSNIETLVNFKTQAVLPLRTQASLLAGPLESRDFDKVRILSSGLTSYFFTMQRFAFFDIPSVERFERVAMEVPMLSAMLHRAGASLVLINELIADRNADVRGYATAGDGSALPLPLLSHYMQMLNSTAIAIGEAVDDALFFSLLAYRQLRFLARKKYPGVSMRVYLDEERLQQLPADDYVAGYARHLKKFELEEESLVLASASRTGAAAGPSA